MSTFRTLLPLLLCASGCAPWVRPPAGGMKLAPLVSPADATVLEITFLDVPGEDGPRDGLWQALDEQALPAEARERLAANGMRGGVAGMQLPPALRALLQGREADATAAQLPAGEASGKPSPNVQQLQVRATQRSEILTAAAAEQLTVLAHEQGEVRGETFREAQCLLAVKVFPAGAGRTRLEFTPEIAHGQPKQRFASGEGSFRVVTRRESQVYDWLKFSVEMAPGQTLVLGPLGKPAGLGRHFFASENSAAGRLLLVRLAQPSGDALFDRTATRPSLATPVE